MIGILTADEYYTRINPGPILDQLYQIGQFFWAPSLFLFGERQHYVVRGSYDPSIGDYNYQIDPMLPDEFGAPQQPVQTLGIRSDERGVILGAKRRPVIIVSRPTIGWADSVRRSEECFLVAPVYSFTRDETRLSYSQTMIERIKGYVYWQLFYLPPSSDGRVREGFVRLDRMQVVHRNLLEHMPVMLSDDSQELLRSWIRVYLGEDLDAVDDVLFDYREQAIEDLRVKGLMP